MLPNRDLANFRLADLLQNFIDLENELLRGRGIMRKRNELTGGYTELLVCRALNLCRAPEGASGYDAFSAQTGDRYQIKGRRAGRGDTLTSRVAQLDRRPFHYLVAVVFVQNYFVDSATIFHFEAVKRHCRITNNGPQLSITTHLKERYGWDITQEIREAAVAERKLRRRVGPLLEEITT